VKNVDGDICWVLPLRETRTNKDEVTIVLGEIRFEDGSHIFYTIGSQMAVRFSALRVGSILPPRRIRDTHFCQRQLE
jgi:hypothetical protein